MAYFFSLKDLNFKDHPKFPGVKIAIPIDSSHNSQISVCILSIAPGVEIPIHIHEKEIDSIYVLEGKGEVFIDGSWHNFQAGDYVFVPPEEEHGVKNSGSSPLKLFVVHSPPMF